MASTSLLRTMRISKTGPTMYVAAQAAGIAVLRAGGHDIVYVARRDAGTVDAYRAGAGQVALERRLVLAGARPAAIAVHPRGSFAFTVDEVQGTLASYRLTPSGKLAAEPLSIAATGKAPCAIAIEAAGERLAVANRGSDDISLFGVGAGGALELLARESTGLAPAALAFPPDGAFLYGANRADHSVAGFAVRGGRLGAIACSAAKKQPAALAVHPNGRFLYVVKALKDPGDFFTSISRFCIGADGRLQPAAPAPDASDLTGRGASAIAIAPDGRSAHVFCAAGAEVWGYRIDPRAGLLRHRATASLAPAAPGHAGESPYRPGDFYVHFHDATAPAKPYPHSTRRPLRAVTKGVTC